MDGGRRKRAKAPVGNRSLTCEENSAASQERVPPGEGPSEAREPEKENEASTTCSVEMEMRIAQIIEKVEDFTRQVAEMLEAGKTMFKSLSAEFEERLISIHREQVDKWEVSFKELRLVDAANEDAGALLQKARYHLLQNVQMDS